jgi:hypothetical protein
MEFLSLLFILATGIHWLNTQGQRKRTALLAEQLRPFGRWVKPTPSGSSKFGNCKNRPNNNWLASSKTWHRNLPS